MKTTTYAASMNVDCHVAPSADITAEVHPEEILIHKSLSKANIYYYRHNLKLHSYHLSAEGCLMNFMEYCINTVELVSNT